MMQKVGFSDTEINYRKQIRSLGGTFTHPNDLPVVGELHVKDLIVISGELYRGTYSEDSILLFRYENNGPWYIPGKDFSEDNYEKILKALQRVHKEEEDSKSNKKKPH